jgi:hypothetical protein
MPVKEILQQIHDEIDHIIGTDRFIKSLVISDAKFIKRLVKNALKDLEKDPQDKPKWFKFENGGKGSKQAHAHLRTDAHGEIEFQCGLQRHMDDTILALQGSKKCSTCVRYLKQKP